VLPSVPTHHSAMNKMPINPQPSPFAPSQQAFGEFPAVQKAQLDHISLALESDQGLSALMLESDDLMPEIGQYLVEHLAVNVRATIMEAPWQSEAEFLRALCHALDLRPLAIGAAPSVSQLIAHIVGSLNAIAQIAAPRVLIVTHAHLASVEVMRHILALSSASSEKVAVRRMTTLLSASNETAGRLHTVLIGRHELRQRLPPVDAKLAQLAKLEIYNFPELSELDTIDHIRGRMNTAGWEGPLPFGLDALKRIHTASKGLPKKIDWICEGALNLAQQHHSPTVTDALVARFLGQQAPSPAAAPIAPAVPLARPVAPAVHGAPAQRLDEPAAAPTRGPTAKRVSVLGVVLGAAIAGTTVFLGTDWPGEAAPAPFESAIGGLQMARESAPNIKPQGPEPEVAVAAAVESAPSLMEPVAADPPLEAAPSGDVFPVLASLNNQADAGWGPMGTLWGLKLNGSKACDQALKQGHQCFRTLNADLPTLRALDRPGLVQLQQGSTRRWVQLTQWSGNTFTLATDKANWQMSSDQFAQIWSGDFTTLWRHPPGQTGRLFAAKPHQPAGQWLDQQLQNLQAKGELNADARSNAARVLAFQKRHGLPGDGKALPSTFIAINRLTGVNEPKLTR
jgi:general secretion pathway protein A